MFERLRQLWSPPPATIDSGDEVSRWATSQFLGHHRIGPHQFELSGRLHGCDMRAECAASSRPYITGLELRARVDLGLPPTGHVIVMNRPLLQQLETQADELFQHAVGEVKTRAKALPEELRWLTAYRRVRWNLPDMRFWERYAVLSDAEDLARRWLDEGAHEYLMAGDAPAAAQVPLMLMLMRGKCYLRLQVNPHAQGADAALALELLEHLSSRALELAARAGVQGADGVSNPG